jgi:hypothetical protein
MSELKNSIYSAVVRITEELERDRIYTGNGHHLAQRITEAVEAAIIDETDQRCKGRKYNEILDSTSNGRPELNSLKRTVHNRS